MHRQITGTGICSINIYGGDEMNKLEQAIAYFEDAIKEIDEIIFECSEKLQKVLTEQKKHFEVALKIMKNQNQENKRLD